ncbi:MAG: hypothetical protein AAGA54_29295 [Myxococcota bacterium]
MFGTTLWCLAFGFEVHAGCEESVTVAERPQNEEGRNRDRRAPPRPPKAAVDACIGKQRDAACSFEGRQGETVQGTCFSPADDAPLACRPSGGRGPGQGGPPPQG